MWIDVEQNTDEWFNLRLGKATSSNFAKIMANYPNSLGKGATEYAQKIALEIVTGVRDESSLFTNHYMQRGHEYESEAIRLYEMETFTEVINGGFNDCDRLGDSPDGNVGKDGCIEVKTVIPNVQWNRIKNLSYDPNYFWQIMGHIWLGEKEWCDFISYCPEMPKNKQLHIHRVIPNDKSIECLKNRIKEFLVEVDENVELLIK